MITKLQEIGICCFLYILIFILFGCAIENNTNSIVQPMNHDHADGGLINNMNELTASIERLQTYREMVSLLGLPKKVSGSGISICEYDVAVPDSSVRRVVIWCAGESAESKVLFVKWMSDLDANN